MILPIEPKNSRKTTFVVCIVTSEDFVEKNQKLDGFLIPANTLWMKSFIFEPEHLVLSQRGKIVRARVTIGTQFWLVGKVSQICQPIASRNTEK